MARTNKGTACTHIYVDKFGDFVYRLYPIELDLRMPQMQLDLLHTLTVMVGQQQNFTTKETI
jgi:hypothetical protein